MSETWGGEVSSVRPDERPWRHSSGEEHDVSVRGVEWQRHESGPPDANRTVLLLPGGLCSADSFAEVMAEPVLAGVRLVAVTLPGHAGAPPPADFSIESYARQAAQLADDIGADVVAGYSIGAAVAFEMAASGGFTGPVVLLGVSLSSKDEPAFFRWLVQSTAVLGSTPSRVLVAGTTPMIKRSALPDDRKREVQAMLRKNVPRDATHTFASTSVGYTARTDQPSDCVRPEIQHGSCMPRRATAGSPNMNVQPLPPARTFTS